MAKIESPMMKHFMELKAKHPEAVLLFRCGDFYEAYEDDAMVCADVLGITLTTHSKDGYKMASFPHHALDAYLPRLIRAGKRVAICDKLEDPKLTKRLVKRGITELASTATKESETTISNNEETMAKNLQATDLIGKTIVNGNMSYNIMGGEGDVLTVECVRDGKTTPMPPMKVAQIQKLIDGGWTFGDATTTASETVEEVTEVSGADDITPVATTVTMQPTEKPKRQAKKSDKPTAKTETKATGGLRYETYTNKKGKVCARIVGLKEDDAAYQQAEELHASATYERTKQGDKVYLLIFGPRYAEAAKEVCQVLNEGKTLADCKAIIDKATADRQQQREEWKARRAERNENANQPTGYTDKDVADMLKKIMAGGAIPEGIKAAMAA